MLLMASIDSWVIVSCCRNRSLLSMTDQHENLHDWCALSKNSGLNHCALVFLLMLN
jgi:hypothetical protein